ncbi:hypothetical protein E1408_22505 [Salmonella enterica subsp. enterica serovar Senftenberg]|nr:hypothetical protein [Salmonella enterica subsp. enterica serovar Senftenberg]
MTITVDYLQTNRKTDTGKTLKPWPVLVDHYIAGVQLATLIMPRSASTDNGFASLPRWTIAWQFGQGMLWKVRTSS